MFAPKPVVPRNEDGIPRFVFVCRTSVPLSSHSGAWKSVDSLQRYAEGTVEKFFPGAKIVEVLSLSAESCDRATLAELKRRIEVRACDAVVVDDLRCLGRGMQRCLAWMQELLDAGGRLISLADRFDTGPNGWEMTCYIAAF